MGAHTADALSPPEARRLAGGLSLRRLVPLIAAWLLLIAVIMPFDARNGALADQAGHQAPPVARIRKKCTCLRTRTPSHT